MKIISSRYLQLLVLLASVFLYSCKKDTGNYDYKSVIVPDLSEIGLAGTYRVNQNENLYVDPKVLYEGDTAKLAYEWICYPNAGLIAYSGPTDFLSNQRILNVPITFKPGNYYIELIVTDETTGYKTNARAALVIVAGMESGLMVLHTKNNQSDVDFILTRSILPSVVDKHDRNLFATLVGSPMNGEGRFLGQTRRSNSDFNFINVATNNSFQRMHGFTFSFIAANQELFRRPVANINPQAHISNSTYEFLINDGKLYSGYMSAIQDAFYSAPYRGNYYLEPYMTFFNYNIYGAVVYDRLQKRFMYSTTAAAQELDFAYFKDAVGANPLFNLNNIGMDLLYMETGFSNYTYAFFKNGSDYKLHVFTLARADDGDLAVASYDMSNLPEIAQAKYFDVGTIGNVALYATDKKVYRYDYSGTNDAYVQLDGFAGNENITGIRLFKATLNSNNNVADFNNTNNTVLFVSTWNGSEGKVYEYSINAASGVINPTPVKTYTGFGRVADMMFKFRGPGT